MARPISELSSEELRAVATSLEEEDAKIPADFSTRLSETHPATARLLASMRREDKEPRRTDQQEDESTRRTFILHIIQPGLAGLMDGSVSTLAPVFAAAYATHQSWYAFLVGLAASIGAGISMGFAEALSDDGVLSGRGHPLTRGIVCGAMTTLGGIGHTLPFLIPDFRMAMIVAVCVVAVELAVISWIRHRFMDTPLLAAGFQVVIGGVLVFLTGILIGSAGR